MLGDFAEWLGLFNELGRSHLFFTVDQEEYSFAAEVLGNLSETEVKNPSRQNEGRTL
jgi:hypothetical protein